MAMVESVTYDGCFPRFPDCFTHKFKQMVYVYKKIWKQMKDGALGRDIENFAEVPDFWKSVMFCARANSRDEARALLAEWLISKRVIVLPPSARDGGNAKKQKCFMYLARYMLSMHVVEHGFTKLENVLTRFDDFVVSMITYSADFCARVNLFNEGMHKQDVRRITDETVANIRRERKDRNSGDVKFTHKDGVRITCNAWMRHIENWDWTVDKKHQLKTVVRISFGMSVSALKDWTSVMDHLPPVFFELGMRLQNTEEASVATSRVDSRQIIGM
ncbi:hypothetical protein CYMTET_31807 [Cymbomonas tetramitiformis]|uniref:Uncharacterized protein n=1 Tax=Cymbomonas tetramitiformis TaxID=36881 RepID=A0AAE0FG12_9CHLO|nr:hypothetical protein CYMTET_41426 [Cymbomonas tetramitiformis]KAK3259147.1 hypothetical protein CYMTET_31807 [Cymbomonas tetramitiformis]